MLHELLGAWKEVAQMKGNRILKKICFLSFLLVHIVISLVIAIILFGVLRGQPIKIQRIEFVLNAIITCSSTLIGFMLTSISIIYGLVNTALFKMISKTKGRFELSWRYGETMLVGIVLIVLCIIIGEKTGEDGLVPLRFFQITTFFTFLFLVSFILNCVTLIKIIVEAPASDNLAAKRIPSAPKGEYRIGQSKRIDDTQEPE